MVVATGLLHSLGTALNGLLAASRCSGVTVTVQTQGLRCLATAAAERALDAAAPERQVRSSAGVPAGNTGDTSGHGAGGGAANSSAGGPSSSSSSNEGGFKVGFRRVVSDRQAAEHGALEGIIHIQNTFNNIILTLTDQQGFIKTYTSAGIVGFRGARRSQPVAAERAAEELARRALKLGYSTVSVRLKGPGNTKQYAVQSLAAGGLQIKSLADVTPIPYNGCRLPKKRRV